MASCAANAGSNFSMSPLPPNPPPPYTGTGCAYQESWNGNVTSNGTTLVTGPFLFGGLPMYNGPAFESPNQPTNSAAFPFVGLSVLGIVAGIAAALLVATTVVLMRRRRRAPPKPAESPTRSPTGAPPPPL
jgi:hypothetical protein